jgi:hypothetical protein
MHKLLMLGAPALLVACATAQPPVHGVTPGRICNGAGTDRFVGQAGSSETGAAILAASNSAKLRWAPPGTAMTMDYRQDRVTVYLDAANRITRISCG